MPKKMTIAWPRFRSAISRAMDLLLMPVIGLIVLGELSGLFDIRPYVVFISFAYLIKERWFSTLKDRSDSPTLIHLAVVLVVITEIVVYFASSYEANTFHYVFQSLFLFAFYWLVWTMVNREYQFVLIALMIAVIGFGLGLRSIYLFFVQYRHLVSIGFVDAADFKHFFYLGNQGDASVPEWMTVFLVILPFTLLLLSRFQRGDYLGKMLVVPTVVSLLAILLTFSRGLYLATAIFALIAIALCYYRRLYSLKSLAMFTGLLCVLIGAFITITSLWQPFLTTVSVLRTQSQVRSVEGRLVVWKTTLRSIKSNPVLGIGTNNFAMHYSAFKDSDAPYVGRALNGPLEILSERGLVGLLSYGFLFIAFLGVSFRKLQAARLSSFHMTAVVLFATTCLALLVRDLSYSSMLRNRGVCLILWFMFASVTTFRDLERCNK